MEFKSEGLAEITIDSRDSLTVIGEPLNELTSGERVKVALSVRRVFEIEGMVLSPGSCWITVYRESSGYSLFLVSGDRNEESISIIQSGPNEEKSEIRLEKVCCLSAFKRSTLQPPQNAS